MLLPCHGQEGVLPPAFLPFSPLLSTPLSMPTRSKRSQVLIEKLKDYYYYYYCSYYYYYYEEKGRHRKKPLKRIITADCDPSQTPCPTKDDNEKDEPSFH